VVLAKYHDVVEGRLLLHPYLTNLLPSLVARRCGWPEHSLAHNSGGRGFSPPYASIGGNGSFSMARWTQLSVSGEEGKGIEKKLVVVPLYLRDSGGILRD